MKFKDAVARCHVRSGIYRTGDPTKVYTEADLLKIEDKGLRSLNEYKVGTTVPKVYWKNSLPSIPESVPLEDRAFDDWEEYDPRERPECSAFEEMPA